MKRVLLSLCLICAVLFGRAQVMLNEMVTNPGSSQFLELYNAGNSQVDLSCYSIVSLGISSGVITNFNIIDFPDGAVIPAKGYYTAGKSANVAGQGMNYNWNATTQPAGASFKSYTVSGNKITGPTTGSNDFFLESSTGNTKLAVFLFNGSNKDANNNVAYVDGLVTFGNLTNPTPNPTLPGVPSSFNFATLSALSNPTAACGPSQINWSKITISEYSPAATGNNHGYGRAGNGLCGTWQKETSGFTPNAYNTNIPVNYTSNSGTLTSNQNILCGGSLLAFNITGGDSPQFPITIELYYDDNNNGILEANEFQNTITGITSLPYSGTFNVTPGKNIYLVYKTPLGCISNVLKPTAATVGTLTTTERNICGNQIDFAVTGVTGDLATYGLPLNVQLYEDYGTIGSLDPTDDVAIGSPVTVNTASNTKYSIPIPTASKGKQFLLVYTSSSNISCLSKKVVIPQDGQITFTTTQKNICGNYVEVSASAATLTGSTLDPTNYVVPMIAELHWDANNSNSYDPSDPNEATVLASQSITSLSATKYSIAIPAAHKNDNIIVVYKTAQDCFSKTALPSSISGSLITAETNTCNKRIDFSITDGTGDALTYALPITVELRNATDNTLLNSTTVSSFSSNVLSLSVPDPSKSVVLVYKPAASCLGKTATPAATSAALEIGGNIPVANVNANGTRTVSYFVVNTATNTLAFPLDLKLYEDVDKNGTINSVDKLIGQQTINSISQSQIFSADITNPNSLAIVTAASVPSGCAQANLPLSNSNALVTILPVHFATFSAMRNNSNKSMINLKWSTATEQNNRGFNVQRNTGNGWKTIAFVFSLADGGNSNALLSYEYKDANSEKGMTQYRIQQVDMDGKASFSDVRTITGIEKAEKVMVYPNPSNNGKVNVQFETPSVRSVVVSDVTGRIVKEYNNVTGNSLEIATLAPGFYSIKVTDLKSGVIAVEKVIIK